MSWIKRYYEQISERMEKAFPELNPEAIANNIAMAENMDEAMFMCMKDAEKVEESYRLFIQGSRAFKKRNIRIVKNFKTIRELDKYIFDLSHYAMETIRVFGYMTIGDLKEYTNSALSIKLSDYKYGWTNMYSLSVTNVHKREKVVDLGEIVEIM